MKEGTINDFMDDFFDLQAKYDIKGFVLVDLDTNEAQDLQLAKIIPCGDEKLLVFGYSHMGLNYNPKASEEICDH